MLTALAGFVALGVACVSDDFTSGTQTATATHPPAVSATATPTSLPTATLVASTIAPTPTSSPIASVCLANPDPATPAQVVVSQPAANVLVTSPLTVAGQINAFEATFEMAIKDASGADIATKTGHSQTGQMLSPFSESVPFTVSAETPACLWVFQFSAMDGSPSMILQVPIAVMP
jgi:Immunoglobulin-like domain of bacterial spore germination